MPKHIGEKILAHCFLESELEALSRNHEFATRREQAQTLKDFQELCLIGFEWLAKEKNGESGEELLVTQDKVDSRF